MKNIKNKNSPSHIIYIVKVFKETNPDEYCYWWLGTQHKHPETACKYYFKSRRRLYETRTNGRYRPYYKFADDNMGCVVMNTTHLRNINELDALCNGLNKDLPMFLNKS